MSFHEHRYSFPGQQREQRQKKQGLRWSMNIAASKPCSTPVSIPSRACSGIAGTAPQILTQARTTTRASGEVGMAAISSQLGKGKSTGQSVSSMRLSRQFSTQSGHQHFTPTCSLAASAAMAPRMNMNSANDSDAKSTRYRFTGVDSPRPLSSPGFSSSSSASSLPSLSSLSSSASCSTTSTSVSTSASPSVPASTPAPAYSALAPTLSVPHTSQCAPLPVVNSSSVSCSESSLSLSSSPISPISSHPPHHRYSPGPAASSQESPPQHERNHSQKQKHKQHKVRQHHTSDSSAPLSPPPSHPTPSSRSPCSPHSPQPRSAHHRCHVRSLCCQIDNQEQEHLASDIPSTKGTPSPTTTALILCSQRTPAGKELPGVPIDQPFLIHTSGSLTFFPSPSPSSALNISPVECQSLSPTTATPADALYLASRPLRASSIESFKRKSSSFFSSLTPSSSASSLPSFSSPTPPAAATDASAPYRSPDYLTAYFAETTRPRRATVPPSQSPAGPPAHPSSRSAAVTRHDRFRPLTVVPSLQNNNPTVHPTPATTPDLLDSDRSSPGVQDSLSSSSHSSLPGQDRWSLDSGRSNTTGSLRQHARSSTLTGNTPTTHTYYTYSTASRYHPRRSTAASSLYQPIMSPLKAKQLSFITTEQPKHGPARSTQSTLTGGDWGERTTAGGAAGVSSAGQDQQAPTLHSAEPNSAASGQDPWMVVTGSGSSYASNSAGLLSSSGFPPSSSTPLGVREEQLNRLPPLQLLDRHEDSDPVLDLEVAHQIRLELPRKLRNATKWNLVYSSDQHGISMTTLYHRCKGKGPMVLAIKDSTDAVFGAYVNEEFKPNLTYYGTGECFLWNVTTHATSPQPPPSPAFAPSPLPSPSPFQLSSTVTTPISGRSPSPSPYASGNLVDRDNCNTGRGGDRRHDLFMAMNDRLSTTVVASNNNPALCSPSPLTYTPQTHLASSPSSSPTLRPVVSPSSSTSIQPRPASATRRKKKQKVVQFWKWTGKNDYMILSEPGFIGLGGGDGKFGLWIHSDLERGHSASCATFDNEPLAVACHQPLRLEDPQQQKQQQRGSGSTGRMVGVDREKAVGGGDGSRSNSRSSSPKEDREEFFCQTVEIWAMVL